MNDSVGRDISNGTRYEVGETYHIFYLVNRARTTTIPAEVASHIQGPRLTLLTYYADGNVPPRDSVDDYISLDASKPIDAAAARRLAGAIEAKNPDVLHLHHTASSLVGALIGQLMGVPAIVKSEHHDHRDLRSSQVLVGAVVFAVADAVTCNSQSTLDSYYPWEDLLAGSSSRVVHNGVDVGWIDQSSGREDQVRASLGIEPDAFLVGSVASLVEQKNLSTLVRAAGFLPDEVRFVIVGDGPLEEELDELRQRCGVQDQVEFVGRRPRSEVYQFLHALDAFVMPSITEGFCVALVEAMAAGLPVLCSDIQTFHEVAGEPAQYVEPRDPAALADALEYLIAIGPDARSEIGERSRMRALREFPIEKTARSYVNVYRDALGEKPEFF